ncbi:hypothetical protein WA026_014520 [Henosepilachna vigintioctopunctata]|uniref:Ribosomal RNA-processing protein 14/surfeit locus protein 6 C-terminal domain-containing protein n=1 Tax=Henosepilachna vigintioctopunctata TaxID=420089 RepID=A0AAW1UBV9_9CUCU
MKMEKTQEQKKKVSLFAIKELVVRENAFIKNLFSVMCMPNRNEEDSEVGVVPNVQRKQISNVHNNPRAKSLTELQERFEALKGKQKLTYKDKRLKKGIKNRLKKKTKKNERTNQKKLVDVMKIKTEEVNQDGNEKPPKPIFNSEGKMVFSKFDFSNIGNKNNRKHLTDPKKLLSNLEKQNEKITSLKESGEIDRAVQLKEKNAWKNALAKASGEKVRDDPALLKKTIKRKEQHHKSSKKKWEARQNTVIKNKEEKQNKRQENIDKRKKSKKLTKLKKAAKKGKIIPGF